MEKVTTTKSLPPKKMRKKESIKLGDLLFYIAIVAWPVVQFAIFYIGVNFNSFLMGFQNYDMVTKQSVFTLDKIKISLYNMLYDVTYMREIGNGIAFYFVGLIIGTPLTLIFSYYIYKRCFGYNTFRIFLFLPSIISSMVLVLIYHVFINIACKDAFSLLFNGKIELEKGFLDNENTRFWFVVLFNIFFGFGGGVLIYSDSMGSISPEVVESASLDGATGLREFISITFPLIYGMWSTLFITGIAGVFNNAGPLYSFWKNEALDFPDVSTFGYRLYINTVDGGRDTYNLLSAYGLWLTFVTIPVTFLVKFLMEKFGPSTE